MTGALITVVGWVIEAAVCVLDMAVTWYLIVLFCPWRARAVAERMLRMVAKREQEIARKDEA